MLRRLPAMEFPRRRWRRVSNPRLMALSSDSVLHRSQIAYRQADHGNQIGRRPVAIHESLAHADVAPKERARKKRSLCTTTIARRSASRRAKL